MGHREGGGFTNATVLLSGCKSSFSTGGKRENMKNSSWHQDSLSRHETKAMEKLKHIRKICLCKGKGSHGEGKLQHWLILVAGRSAGNTEGWLHMFFIYVFYVFSLAPQIASSGEAASSRKGHRS